MTEAAPRPWSFVTDGTQTEGHIFGADNYCVTAYDLAGSFQLGGRQEWETEMANAALIVKAVNRDHLFDELVEVLEWAATRLEVDGGMTEKEQETTAKRLHAVLARVAEQEQ